MTAGHPDRFETAKKVFRDRGGVLKTGEALSAGIHPRTLYDMERSGILEKLARGLYRIADMPPLGNPDLVSVALKVPNSVICLISALAYHKITTQIPHEVYLALDRGATPLDWSILRSAFSGSREKLLLRELKTTNWIKFRCESIAPKRR